MTKKIVFIGASTFGFKCLQQILSANDCIVAGIVTNPKNFSISYNPQVENINHADFGALAKEYNIPLYVMTGKMSDQDLVEQIKVWQPDLILVVGWYHLVPKVIRDIAPVFGLHASLLPKYSGGAPLVWAIINGEQETGITFFKFEDKVDGGDIVAQAKVSILLDDTIATLYKKIETAGLGILNQSLIQLLNGEASFTKQDESQRTIVPQRSPADGIIVWNNKALTLYNFIRAQTYPYPGAFTNIQGEKILVWEAELFKLHASHKERLYSPGEIIEINPDAENGILVATNEADYAVLLTTIGRSYGEILLVQTYLNLYPTLKAGDILGG